MKPEQDLGQEPPLLRAEPAHDAEIDGAEPALRIDEQVSGVHVGMEEAVAQRMPQEGLDHDPAQGDAVVARLPRSPSMALSGMPSIHSMVSTSRAVALPVDRRNAEIERRRACSPPSRTRPRPRAEGPSPSSRSGPASRRRRSGLQAAQSPARCCSRVAAAKAMASRSRRNRARTPGRSTFTATTSLARRRQRPWPGGPARSTRRQPAR